MTPTPSRASFLPDAPQALLLHTLLSMDRSAAQAYARDWLDMIDFDGLDGGSYRLMPLLHTRLLELEVEHSARPRIKGMYRQAWYASQRLRQTIRPLLAELDTAEIDWLILKGIALGHSVYEDVAERPTADIDLLVRHRDEDRVADLLTRLGWVRGRQWLNARTFERPGGAELDLHLSPYVEAASESLVAPLWFRRRRIPTPDGILGVLSRTDQLLHSLANGQRGDFVPQLRWIVDSAKILREASGAFDFEELAEECRRLDMSYIAAKGLAVIRQFAPDCIPAFVPAQLERNSTALSRVEFALTRTHISPGPVAVWFHTRRVQRGLRRRSLAILRFYKASWAVGSWRELFGRAALRLVCGSSCSRRRRLMRGLVRFGHKPLPADGLRKGSAKLKRSSREYAPNDPTKENSSI